MKQLDFGNLLITGGTGSFGETFLHKAINEFKFSEIRVFIRDDTQGSDFLAASVSTSNQWLYVATDDGKCIVFDINTGSVEKIVRDFAEECSTRSDKASEISGIISHPHRGMIGGFCNDKSQKRGILTLWK